MTEAMRKLKLWHFCQHGSADAISAVLCGLCVLLNAVSSQVRCKLAVKGTFADAECWAILRDGVEKFAQRD
jgi:hypothetical protein